MTVDVTRALHAALPIYNTVTVLEDGSKTFSAADFGFTDPNDAGSSAGANSLAAVKITTLPGQGSLTDNGNPVSSGDFVSVADVNAGLLVFTPDVDANGSG